MGYWFKKEVLSKLSFIIKNQKTIMAQTQERFDLLMSRLDKVSNDIAADYQQMRDEAKKGTVSDESFAKAEANIAKLEALGASVENPVPEGETPTGETPTEEEPA